MTVQTTERVKKAKKEALEYYMDYIYEIYIMPDFVEVKGSMGNDTVRYRFYDDGSVCSH